MTLTSWIKSNNYNKNQKRWIRIPKQLSCELNCHDDHLSLRNWIDTKQIQHSHTFSRDTYLLTSHLPILSSLVCFD